MSVKLLTEHHLEILSLKGSCTGTFESTLVKMPHCWKSHVTAQILSFIPVILPGAVLGLYSGIACGGGDIGLEGGDFLDPLPGLPLSTDPGVSLTGGVPRPWGEVILWCVGETTLLAGEVSLRGGEEARGVLPLDERGVPPLLGVPGLPDLSFMLPLLGLTLGWFPAWNRSASRSSRSYWSTHMHGWKFYHSRNHYATIYVYFWISIKGIPAHRT